VTEITVFWGGEKKIFLKCDRNDRFLGWIKNNYF